MLNLAPRYREGALAIVAQQLSHDKINGSKDVQKDNICIYPEAEYFTKVLNLSFNTLRISYMGTG